MDKINRDLPNNIWNKEGFAMCGFGERSGLWGKIKHIKKCIYWSKQRIVRGYAEERKLNAYRIECKDEALDLLKEYFYSLWT